jgi:hypothetical protein
MSSLIDESNVDSKNDHFVQFWLYLISNTLSILCCIFILYHLLSNRTLRNALHNHIIIILLFQCLIYELIDIPIILYNYSFETFWERKSILYRFWSFIDIGLYTTQLIIFAWGTIERHILVFHNQWLSTKKKCFYIHYLPMIILITYCLVWYGVTILFPCCMLNGSIIKYYDLICHQMIPSGIIIVFSIGLLLRKSRFDWAIERKMIFQILSISILYWVFCGPWIFVLFCFQFNSLGNIGLGLLPYAYFFSYYFMFLLPFVCCSSLFEVQLKLKKLLCRR